MEQELEDFDQWIQNYKLPPTEFVAVFDPNTGAVISVGPSHAFKDQKHKIVIDQELAESINNSEIRINNCVVDINSNTIEVAEIQSVYKIDDVLHRIASTKYSNIEKPDMYLTHNKKNKTLKIELGKEFGGTKKSKIPYRQRNIIWDGDTVMDFFITEYNDPNLTFETVSVKINDLIGKSKIIENVSYENFSVYTRRLFKNYVIEYR
jgi:hypothetical protein